MKLFDFNHNDKYDTYDMLFTLGLLHCLTSSRQAETETEESEMPEEEYISCDNMDFEKRDSSILLPVLCAFLVILAIVLVVMIVCL